MAGIYPPNHDGLTVAIITTSPNVAVEPIHDGMPVIIGAKDYDAWLDPSTDLATLQGLMRPLDGYLSVEPERPRGIPPVDDEPTLFN